MASPLTWEEKLVALQALGATSPRMHSPGNWYVDQRSVEVGGDGVLRGTYGIGETPEVAVQDHWRKLVDELPDDRYLVVDAYTPRRRHVRWNGYEWVDLPIQPQG